MAVPPRTDQGSTLRDNLRKAQALLNEAGWTYRDGALRNAQGEPFTIEFLDSTEARGATTAAAWRRALEKLGIDFRLREVDFALWQQRLESNNFEMLSISFPGTHFPGADYADLFGSKAADMPGSGNYCRHQESGHRRAGRPAAGRGQPRGLPGHLPRARSRDRPRALPDSRLDHHQPPHRLQRLGPREARR